MARAKKVPVIIAKVWPGRQAMKDEIQRQLRMKPGLDELDLATRLRIRLPLAGSLCDELVQEGKIEPYKRRGSKKK
jgi:hypothetical protein